MAWRPYWSGQFKISLVSFGIQLFPAINSRSGIAFHQIDRSTGKRVRHLNVIDDREPLENAEIVKGYEYSKGKYLVFEPGEIENLRIATRNVIDVQQFVSLDEIPFALFEKPYFVVPEPKESADAYAVVKQAMEQSGKAAIGEIVFGGREHLVAIAAQANAAPQGQNGLMAYMLRYGEELRSVQELMSDGAVPEKHQIDKKQLEMASQLIEAYSHPFHLDSFKDDYEAALRELIEAKQKNTPLPVEAEIQKPTKVVNLMDALRQSVSKAKRPVASERRGEKTDAHKGPLLVKGSKRKHRAA